MLGGRDVNVQTDIVPLSLSLSLSLSLPPFPHLHPPYMYMYITHTLSLSTSPICPTPPHSHSLSFLLTTPLPPSLSLSPMTIYFTQAKVHWYHPEQSLVSACPFTHPSNTYLSTHCLSTDGATTCTLHNANPVTASEKNRFWQHCRWLHYLYNVCALEYSLVHNTSRVVLRRSFMLLVAME